MSFKLLIDECLNPSLVALAKARGIAADFGPHIGKQGWQDHSLVAFAIKNDYAVATDNRRDFLREYLKYDLHGGLIVVVPHAARNQQAKLFGLALDHLQSIGDAPDNLLIEVLEDGTVHARQWTSDAHDLGHISNPDWRK
ncbi:MAG: DUF5615 family PIN-like protein [Devosia sp.]|nr:DUF5615 family PIN-like protein [Devosia sp.]